MLNFELVSPDQLLISKEATMVAIPGEEGRFSVMGEHAPMIATLTNGTIRVYDGETVVDRVFVEGGFAEVTAKRCTVLANNAITVADLDASALEKEIAELESTYASADDKASVSKALTLAKAKLEATQESL